MLKPYVSAKLLFEEAQKRNLNPVWETSTGLFSVENIKGNRRYIYYTESFANSQLGATMCRDKFLMRSFLAREGYPNIPFLVSTERADVKRFLELYSTIIQKPVRGERAIGVTLIRNAAQINFGALSESIFEQYTPGTEWRCLVLDGSIVAQQFKTPDPTPGHPWQKKIRNLPITDWNTDMAEISLSLAKRLSMNVIAVDFIQTDESFFILEANGTPGLYSFHHPDSGESVDLASLTLSYLLERKDSQ